MILRKHTGLRFWNSNLVYLSINIGYASHQILGFYMDFITMLRSRKTRPMRLTNTQISDGFFNAARLHRPVSSEQKVAVKALQSSILSTSWCQLLNLRSSEILPQWFFDQKTLPSLNQAPRSADHHGWTAKCHRDAILLDEPRPQFPIKKSQWNWNWDYGKGTTKKWEWGTQNLDPDEAEHVAGRPRHRLGPRRLGMGPAVTRSQIFGKWDDMGCSKVSQMFFVTYHVGMNHVQWY